MTADESRPESPDPARRRRLPAGGAPEAQSLQDLLDLSSYWYWERDHLHRLTRIVGRAFEAAGFNPADYLGRLPWDSDALPGEGGSWDRNRAILDARQSFSDLVFKRPNKAGALRYVSTSGHPVFDAAGRFTGYRGIARDITEQVQARLRLTVEHGVTRILAEASGIAEAAPRIIRVICETLGWTCGARWEVDEGAAALRCAETWGQAEPGIEAFLEVTRRHSSAPQPGGLNRRAWISGEPVWIREVSAEASFVRGPAAVAAGLRSAFAFPIKAGGAVVGIMEFFSRDVHPPDAALLEASAYIASQIGQFIKRTHAEEKQGRFRAAIDASADMVLLVDRANMVHVDVNEAACRTLGYSREELLAMGPHDVFSTPREELAEAYGRLIAGDTSETVAEGCLRCKDGSQLMVETFRRALPSPTGHVIVAVARDVTARKREEQLLKLEHTATRVLAEADRVAPALREVMRAVCETLGWECGRYFRMDDEAGEFRFADSWYAPTPELERFIAYSRARAFAPGVGIVGRAGAGEPQWVADVSRDSRVVFPMLAREHGVRTAFMFAVRSGGRTFGVLSFTSREIREPDARLLQAVEVIGSQIGQFMQRKRAEEELRASEARFRAIVDSANEGILVYDRSLKVIGGNGTAERIIGLPLTDIIGAAGFTSLLPCVREDGSPLAPEDRPTRITVRTGEPQTGRTIGIKRADGSLTWLSVNTGLMRHVGDSDYHGVVSTLTDITERKRAELATQRVVRMYAALSATNDAILHAKTPEELYERVCEAAVEGGKLSSAAIFLYRPALGRLEATTGAGVRFERSPAGPSHAAACLRIAEQAFRARSACVSSALPAGCGPAAEGASTGGAGAAAALPLLQDGDCIGAILLRHDEQGAFDDETIGLLERLAQNVSFALANFERERERRRAQERIQYLATHDSLTGLPNRVMFAQLLGGAFRYAQRYQRSLAVLFLDLDRFKVINDTLGHEAGDRLLKVMGARLQQCLRASDAVARLGGDEFVVLLKEVATREEVEAVAHKLLSVVMQPLEVQGHECRVTVSIGISMYPSDAQDEQALMTHADAAMYAAKEDGKNGFRFYSRKGGKQALAQLTLETSLRRALERDEFFLHYQPKMDLATGAVTGVEALLRWHHPDRGLVPPAEFIALAEETGLIVPIGRWVLRAACACSRTWRASGLPPLGIAINLSPRQFGNQRLLRDLADALDSADMAPELLALEVTERAVTVDVEHAARQLAAVKAMGVGLAIDDFGTGYSSLAQLKRFPIDTLKVDRSFIAGVPQSPEDNAITQAIIAMGRALGLRVVAEGVETEAQQRFLRMHGCDEIQGFHVSRPLPADKLAAFLLAWHGTSASEAAAQQRWAR